MAEVGRGEGHRLPGFVRSACESKEPLVGLQEFLYCSLGQGICPAVLLRRCLGFPLPVHHSAVMLTPLSLFFMSDPSSAPWTRGSWRQKKQAKGMFAAGGSATAPETAAEFYFPQSVLQGRSEFCLEKQIN